MVASSRRLGWTVISSTELQTDQGDTLDLLLDSPAAVTLEVARAAKRWRWKNCETLMPQLKKGGSGAGALMEPIIKLLKSKDNNEEWNPALRGSLRSAIAGRQYPQARVYTAGWASVINVSSAFTSSSTLGLERLKGRGSEERRGKATRRSRTGSGIRSKPRRSRLLKLRLTAVVTAFGNARLSTWPS